MMRMVFCSMLLLIFLCAPARAIEIEGTYASISYTHDTILEAFNNNIFLGKLRYLMRGKRILTMEDEVNAKIDILSERIQEVLDMHPPGLHYGMTLYQTGDYPDRDNHPRHDPLWDRAGFYSPTSDTIFLNVNTSNIKVVAHEVGHVVVEKYFKVKPPVKVHELLAQFAEKHIGD